MTAEAEDPITETDSQSAKPKKMDIYRRIAWTLGIFGTSVFIASVGAYAARLGHNGISRTPADWGAYGDFVSGIAGTLIGLATLAA
jgi:hypothetical protein